MSASRGHSGKKVFFGFVMAVIIAYGVIVVGSLMAKRDAPDLPKLGVMPAFEFVDEAGAKVTERDLTGKVLIANFIFTRCDTICPVNSMLMGRIQDETDDLPDAVKLVSFSVDPAYDTPARLAEYGKRYHAKPARWRFFTGDFAQIHRIMEEGLKLALEHGGTPLAEDAMPNINHSGHFVLLDQNLAIRGYYDSTDPGRMQELSHHARYLARKGTRQR